MAMRKVVYDDQDTEVIHYSGEWFEETGTLEDFGNFGPPFLRTLHGTNHNATISFIFDGTDIGVYGTNNLSNPLHHPDPNLECFIDGASIGREPIFKFRENNWKLCGKGGLSARLHELTIEIEVQSPEHTFWLDQIQYIPSPGEQLDNKTIQLANTDPDIQLDASWRSFRNFKATTETNAVAHIDFTGTSVSWVGYIPTELPHGSASGTYSIDDGQPVNFDLAGLNGDQENSEYNQVFFTTSEVENGRHSLTVTFLGSEKTTPLTLDCLYIKNSTLLVSPPNAISIPSTISPSSTISISSAVPGPTTLTGSPSMNLGKSGPNVDALLGGIIGGVGLLIILAGTLLCWRRRRLSRDNAVRVTGATFHPRGEFQAIVGPTDVVTTPVRLGPSDPSARAQETYPSALPGLPANQLSAKWREAFRFVPAYSNSPRDRLESFGSPSWQHPVSSRARDGRWGSAEPHA